MKDLSICVDSKDSDKTTNGYVVSLVGIDAMTVVNLKKVHVSFHCSYTLAPLI